MGNNFKTAACPSRFCYRTRAVRSTQYTAFDRWVIKFRGALVSPEKEGLRGLAEGGLSKSALIPLAVAPGDSWSCRVGLGNSLRASDRTITASPANAIGRPAGSRFLPAIETFQGLAGRKISRLLGWAFPGAGEWRHLDRILWIHSINRNTTAPTSAQTN